MEMAFFAMPFFMLDRVYIFFFGRMLCFREDEYIAPIEGGSLAPKESHGDMLVWFTDLIQLIFGKVFLNDIRQAGGCTSGEKKQDSYKSHSVMVIHLSR